MKITRQQLRKLIIENYKMGAMGTVESDNKERLISKYSSAFNILDRKAEYNINQFLSVILGEKPMFYSNLEKDGSVYGIDIFDKKLRSMISNDTDLKLAFAPHTERGLRGEFVLYFGKPENVDAALFLSKNPLLQKEKYDYEESFWEFAYPRYFKVTPEWNRQLGVLLGYGEENAKKYADVQEERLHSLHQHWYNKIRVDPNYVGVPTVEL